MTVALGLGDRRWLLLACETQVVSNVLRKRSAEVAGAAKRDCVRPGLEREEKQVVPILHRRRLGPCREPEEVMGREGKRERGRRTAGYGRATCAVECRGGVDVADGNAVD